MTPAPTTPASVAAIVTVQVRPEWPAREYSFRDPAQARMFLASCQRDGDYRAALRSAAEAARGEGK